MISVEIKQTSQTIAQMETIKRKVEAAADLERDVYTLERNIVARAPVDTGRYRLGWMTEKTGRYSYEIRNAVEYARYLIFGRAGRGIRHDVRGIVGYWKNHIRNSVRAQLERT